MSYRPTTVSGDGHTAHPETTMAPIVSDGQDNPRPAPGPTMSRSYWDFGDAKEDPIHRIHAYPAKFPAFLTTKALHYAQQSGVKVDLIADVFCGCGTTAVEARRNGKRFWGCDINPVATLIAHVKTRDYDDAGLQRTLHAITGESAAHRPTANERATISDRIRYWFNDPNIESLLSLRHAINHSAPPKSRYRKFFLCAFSNILKPTSRWLTKSIKPQIDPGKSPRSVMEAFADQVTLMRNANRNRAAVVSPGSPKPIARVASPCIRIRTRNFLASRLPSCRPDLVVTSPPYVTSYNYADIHQLSALWLGYVSDYRELRKNMLGNEYGVESLARPAIERLGARATATYDALAAKDERKARSVIRYFHDYDMSKTVTKCWSMLSHGGMVVFVIGNTRYQGIRIDNRTHLKRCMVDAGFHDVKVFPRKVSLKTMTPYRDARGRFTRDSKQRKVYGDEFVVIGRRR